jgi:hypothetical protein
MINNDEAGFIITKKRNRKRSLKLYGEARKRFKNKLPNSAYHDDSELISEIKIGNINRDPETAGTKTETLKINFVNVVTEILIY